jgi:hypothetical protein
MAEPVSLIMRQFLAWVAERPRRREEVREAWRSCPRISVWEDAVMEELVAYDGGLIGLTSRGREALASSADEARGPDGAKRNPGTAFPHSASLHAGYKGAARSPSNHLLPLRR